VPVNSKPDIRTGSDAHRGSAPCRVGWPRGLVSD
jgi:hypothetical protein